MSNIICKSWQDQDGISQSLEVLFCFCPTLPPATRTKELHSKGIPGYRE